MRNAPNQTSLYSNNKLVSLPDGKDGFDPYFMQLSTMRSGRYRGHASEIELRQCFQSLRAILAQSSDIDFGRLCVVFSCMLHCARPLHHTEMSSIITLLLEPRSEDPVPLQAMPILDLLPDGLNSVIRVTNNGFLHFVNPRFPTFLKICPIDGVDQTHSTMARACLSRMETQAGLETNGLEPGIDKAPFLGYAFQYWADHYRCVEQINRELIPRVHRILCKLTRATFQSHEEEMVGDAKNQFSIPTLSREFCVKALLLCQRYGLKVLQSMYAEVLARKRLLADPDRAESTRVRVQAGEPDLRALARLQLCE